jgi:hypothetical protein
VVCDLFYCGGVLFAIYMLVLFENRVTRIMFELKTEEMGGKRCISCSFVMCTACQILGYQTAVAKWVRNVACMGVKVILNRFFLTEREGKCPSRRPVWIWEDNIEMDCMELYEDGFWLFMLWERVEWHFHEPYIEP